MSLHEQHTLIQRSLKRNPYEEEEEFYDGELLTPPGRKHEGDDRLDGAHGAVCTWIHVLPRMTQSSKASLIYRDPV